MNAEVLDLYDRPLARCVAPPALKNHIAVGSEPSDFDHVLKTDFGSRQDFVVGEWPRRSGYLECRAIAITAALSDEGIRGSLVVKSQRRTVVSQPADRSRFVPGCHASAGMRSVCPERVSRSFPAGKSQTPILRSSDALASIDPSALKASAEIVCR